MNRNYIILNGVNSQTIEGLFIKDLPPITKPPMRNTKEEIDGRDGDIITKLGYGAYDKEITIGLANNYDIDEVIAFFTKEANPSVLPFEEVNQIVFSNEPEKVYYFSQLDQIDFNKLIKFRTATVSFHCQPFKYEYDENFISFIPQTTTGTGTTITLTPSSPTKLTLGLKGNTEQDISKNIFQTNGNITYGGITTTDNGDGTLTLSNSASVDIVALQSEKTQAIAAGTYTFSIQEALPFNIYFMFTLSGSMSSATINAGQTSTTFTTQAISKYRLWASGLTTGTTYNQTIKIQLEEGSTPTKWLPYGVPNPSSPTEVKTVTGDNTITITNADSSESQSYPLNLGVENLFQVTSSSSSTSGGVTYNKLNDNSFEIASDGSNSWARADITLPNSLQQNTDYTFKLNFTSTNTNITTVRASFRTSSSEIKYQDLSNGGTVTFNTGANIITLIRLYITTNTAREATVTFTDIQLEKGSIANSYTPYGTIPIELCKIGNYQDYIYKQDGKFYKHKEIGKLIIDSSTITARTSYTNIDYAQIPKPTDYNGYNEYYSDNYFTYNNYAPFSPSPTWDSANNVGKLYTGATKTVWWVGFTKNTSLANMQQALDGGITYYPLNTPIEEEITDSNIVQQLRAIDNAYLYSGVNNIYTTSLNDLPITLDFDYYTLYKGTQGLNSYLHVKWSEDGETFSVDSNGIANGEVPAKWQGTYVDNNPIDSDNFDDYEWVDTSVFVEGELQQLEDSINNVDTTLTNKLNETNQQVETNKQNLATITTQVTSLNQEKDNINIQIQSIRDNGVTKVVTGTGFRFDENGLDIEKTGENLHNTLDNTGMFVKRKDGSTEVEVLGADQTGVRAENVTVRNWLIIGSNSRMEDFEDGTGVFYIGGAS